MGSKSSDINEAFVEACKSGDLPKVLQLMKEGADVNSKICAFGVTPLLWAVFRGHEQVVRYLIEQGADVNYDGFIEQTALMNAAFRGDLKLMKILIDAGADVNLTLPNGGETALHMAAFKNQKEAVKLLIQSGANINQRTKEGGETQMFSGGARLWGETALHFAAAYADTEMVEILISAGADKTIYNTHGELPAAYFSRHRFHQPREILDLLK